MTMTISMTMSMTMTMTMSDYHYDNHDDYDYDDYDYDDYDQCCGAGPTLTRLWFRLRLPALAPDYNIFVTQI